MSDLRSLLGELDLAIGKSQAFLTQLPPRPRDSYEDLEVEDDPVEQGKRRLVSLLDTAITGLGGLKKIVEQTFGPRYSVSVPDSLEEPVRRLYGEPREEITWEMYQWALSEREKIYETLRTAWMSKNA